MSAVRMCDRCGVIFSENAEGWGVGTISTNVRDERTRQPRMVQQSIDMCPVCNRGPAEHLTPAIAGVAEAERLASVQPQPPESTYVGPHTD